MQIYIALLRGINVGGNKIIKMADLKKLFEALGCLYVQTYIQSGNVVFASPASSIELKEQLEAEIPAVFGFQVSVMIRTVEELAAAVAACPFGADELAEGESLYTAVLSGQPAEEGWTRLQGVVSDADEYRPGDQTVYILCRQSYHKSVFSNNLLEKKLGVDSTVRNWQTMNKLVALGRSITL